MPETPGREQMKRTDEVAHQIEFVTGGKWTPEQYRKVVSLLRQYRHQAVLAIAEQFTKDLEKETGRGSKPERDGASGGGDRADDRVKLDGDSAKPGS